MVKGKVMALFSDFYRSGQFDEFLNFILLVMISKKRGLRSNRL